LFTQKDKIMKLTETPNFKRGIEILKKYEPSPEINDMGDNGRLRMVNLIDTKMERLT